MLRSLGVAGIAVQIAPALLNTIMGQFPFAINLFSLVAPILILIGAAKNKNKPD